MHENTGYEFANIKSTCCGDIANLEKKIAKDCGKDIVLLAFEKKE